MKKPLKLLFTIAIVFGLNTCVYALDKDDIKTTKKENTLEVSFSKYYEDNISAQNAVKDFKDYISAKNGEIIFTNIEKITHETKTQLETGTKKQKEVNDLIEKYKEKSDDKTKYDVVLGKVKEEFEEGKEETKEFDSASEAQKAKEEKEKSSTDEISYTCSVSEIEKIGEYNLFEQTFQDENSAKNYLENLKKEFAVKNEKIDENKIAHQTEETKQSTSTQELDDYKKELEKQGYEVSVVPYPYQAIGTQITNTIIDPINKTFNTKQEAQDYKNSLNKTYDEVQVTVNDESTTKIETNQINEEFDTKEEAENRLNALKQEFTVSNEKITEKQTVIGQTEKETKTKEFTNKEEADNYKTTLENEGYTILSYNVEKISSENQITSETITDLNNNKDLDNSRKNYGHIDISASNSITIKNNDGTSKVVTGNITISTVKINGSVIRMSSHATQDPNGGLASEFTSESRNLSFQNNSTISIVGTLTYQDQTTKTIPINITGILNEAYNQCGGNYRSYGYDLQFNSITVTPDGKIIIDSNIVEIYKVTAEVTKQTYKTTYQLTCDTSKNVTNEKYTVTGTATKYEKSPLYEATYKKTNYTKEYKVTGESAKKTLSYNLDCDYKKVYTTQEYTIFKKEINNQFLASGLGKIYQPQEQATVPKTGINQKNYSGLVILIIIMLSALNIKYFVKQNN